jgi:hypothetical protein
MPDSNIPKDVASSLKGIFTNINLERLSEIWLLLFYVYWFLIALGFKYLYPNHWHRFNAHQRLVWRRGIFILFLLFL